MNKLQIWKLQLEFWLGLIGKQLLIDQNGPYCNIMTLIEEEKWSDND